ncbi:MAG: tRNA (adenosine(37)-N6)-threonylcarbamoyltransferase complex ATPase subunit type 1 TsaE, partial [Prevotella sp.]|nr:tRNA (adenosine(37)-N6)-threonylcarbamoyltransferase complex ATPase subunit type 1 TsaE [Prevotella sp.]MBR3123713.1 tRNA (adenosine(37)-N6)-threonylcarbamoyltransferase complex ATPase subunit type 1 TsaE [Prevotella sp.]MBR7086173.1 tRNA (adenosine(37)-N6)-threonylcarbamoyltransferase complex ATPase subunit type 1 TsaE [Prevotella sp.]
NEYFAKIPANTPIYHFDFYRIRNVHEVYDMGYEEYISSGAVCFMEWPELIEDLLPENTVKVYIRQTENGEREISF